MSWLKLNRQNAWLKARLAGLPGLPIAAGHPVAYLQVIKSYNKKHHTMKRFHKVVIATLAAATIAAVVIASPLWAQQAGTQQPGIQRTDLQRHDLSIPGREVIQARVALAPGAAFGLHKHPGEEIIFVTEGALEYEVEGKGIVKLKAGDVLFVPAGTYHSAKNSGTVTGVELATYVVEKGKPLIELKQ